MARPAPRCGRQVGSSPPLPPLARVLIATGRYDEADRTCRRLSDDHPLKAQCLGRVQLALGKTNEAATILETAPDVAVNPQARGLLWHANARAGRRADAERMVQATTFANAQALIYAGLGDKDRALVALERMGAVGAQRLARYLVSPEFALLSGDERIKSLRRKVGLPL